MRTYARVAVTLLAASAALAALVGTASATRLSLSNQSIRTTWSSLEFTTGGPTIRCSLTLEGSFHARTIAKVARTLIGLITRATARHPCTNGEMWFFNGSEVQNGVTLTNSLPWHITYEGFTGTLPGITGLRILFSNVRFLAELTGLRCIYTTGARGNLTGTATRNTTTGVVDNLRVSGSITPNAESPSGGFCPTFGFASRAEDGAITLLGAATRITLTLI